MRNYCSNPYRQWLIFAFVLISLVPLMLIRDFQAANELRYLSIADEAIRNGNLFTFSNHGEAYADKPPLYLWAVMAGRALFGNGCMIFLWMFSIVPAFVICRVMRDWTSDLIPEKYQATATWMLLSCGLFMVMMCILRMDMLMVMFIILALREAFRIFEEPTFRKRRGWMFGVYVFLGIFSKGPVAIMVPIATTMVYAIIRGNGRGFVRCWGWRPIVVLVGCCCIWWLLAWLEGGDEYMRNLLFHQTVERASHSHAHPRPFYYYFKHLGYTFAPWTLVIIAVWAIAAVKRIRMSALQVYFITAICTTFVMMSAVSSKLDIYLLPTYPFVIYLVAGMLPAMSGSRWISAAIMLPALAFVAAFPLAFLLGRKFGEISVPLYVGAGIFAVTGFVVIVLTARRSNRNAITAMAAGIFVALFVGGFGVGCLNHNFGYGDLCRDAIVHSDAGAPGEVLTYRLKRPGNMDVYLPAGTRVHELVSIREAKGLPYPILTTTKRLEAVRDTLGTGYREIGSGRYTILYPTETGALSE